MKKMKNKTKAFTLIELLVVVAIIASLIAIMAVSLGQVKRVATNLKQKGEFHGLEVSIELFQNAFKYYPDSVKINGGSDYTCGGQRLAETMEGRDERGFHPKSRWHPDLETAAGLTLYDISVNDTTKERKPVYFELKHSGMYTLDELWGVGNTGTLHGDAPILTDVFVRNRAADPAVTEKVGSPVLYFKAHPTKRFRVNSSNQVVNPAIQSEYQQWIYNFDDNIDILSLAWLREPGSPQDTVGFPPHYQPRDDYPGVTDEAELFYQIMTQRQDTSTGFYKPYNASTYILISAGWDGIFGTKDDITSFDY